MSAHIEQLILSAAIGGLGFHPGAAGDARRLVRLDHYRRLVRAAERGRLDFVLLDDARALAGDVPLGRLDALSVLSRLAPETRHVGLAVAKPTTDSEPFHVSREVATLDFVSGGRAAWRPTTSATTEEARNYSRAAAPPADERRARGAEFVDVSRKLWDSWEDDAVIVERARGLYLDPHKLHHIDHAGAHFRIRGPQITYRPPQGHVVVVQVDSGDDGEPLSAAVADVLVLHHPTIAAAREAYTLHHAEASALGREVRVLQSVLPVVGAIRAEARARADRLDAAAPGAVAPRALRLVGTAGDIADTLEEWFERRAVDGFHLLPATLPEGLEELVDTLVPELQRRGLLRTAYAGVTLRDHLGLPRPASQYVGAPSEAHTAYHG